MNLLETLTYLDGLTSEPLYYVAKKLFEASLIFVGVRCLIQSIALCFNMSYAEALENIGSQLKAELERNFVCPVTLKMPNVFRYFLVTVLWVGIVILILMGAIFMTAHFYIEPSDGVFTYKNPMMAIACLLFAHMFHVWTFRIRHGL